MLDMLEFLRDEGVSADITAEIENFGTPIRRRTRPCGAGSPIPGISIMERTSGRRPSPPSSAERTCCW